MLARFDGQGYSWARYYHPGLQRFISEDPIGLLGGPNLYAYADNAPIQFRDPLGLRTVAYGVQGAVGIGGGGSLSTALVADDSCNLGLAITLGGGGYGGAGASLVGQWQNTNAKTIDSLRGWGGAVAVNVGEVGVVGAEFVTGSGYMGTGLQAGLGFAIGPFMTPVMISGEMTYTWVPVSVKLPVLCQRKTAGRKPASSGPPSASAPSGSPSPGGGAAAATSAPW